MRVVTEDMLHCLPFGVLLTDMQGIVTFSNRAAQTLLNLPTGRIEGGPIHSLFPSTALIKALKTDMPNRTVAKTESGVPLLLVELPLSLASESRMGLVLLYPHQILNELAEQSPKFIELRQELEAIMNLIGELVTITDKNGTILRVNAACEKVMGVKERDFVGRPVDVMERQGVVDSSSTKRVISEGRKITVTQTTKSGRRLVVSGYPIYTEEGELHKVINISHDVTEVENLSKQLDEMRQMMRYYQTEWMQINRQEDERVVVRSKAMEEIYDLAGRIADVDSTVLILGESGVGKEVLARTIHNLSPRNRKPFLKINCGAIPETLMESELFGYAKGTFTGGNREGKQGIIVSVHEGTLFLDEIGELPLQLQVKLLQVLQEKQVTPLGKTTPIPVDVRFIAATNRDLEKMVKEGTFREDLYYRLNVVPITIPGLRERKEDIPFLIEHFLWIYSRRYNKSKRIEKDAMQLLINYAWPGNVRELQNTVERLVVTVPDESIQARDLPDKMLNAVWHDPSVQEGMLLKAAVAQYEKNMIQQAVNQSRTLKEVSEKLGVDISTISRKVKKYNIPFAGLQWK